MAEPVTVREVYMLESFDESVRILEARAAESHRRFAGFRRDSRRVRRALRAENARLRAALEAAPHPNETKTRSAGIWFGPSKHYWMWYNGPCQAALKAARDE